MRMNKLEKRTIELYHNSSLIKSHPYEYIKATDVDDLGPDVFDATRVNDVMICFVSFGNCLRETYRLHFCDLSIFARNGNYLGNNLQLPGLADIDVFVILV